MASNTTRHDICDQLIATLTATQLALAAPDPDLTDEDVRSAIEDVELACRVALSKLGVKPPDDHTSTSIDGEPLEDQVEMVCLVESNTLSKQVSSFSVPIPQYKTSERARVGGETASAGASDDEEGGEPELQSPAVDPSLFRPELLEELCNTVWGSCLVMSAAVAAGEPVRRMVREAVTKGMWDAVSIGMEKEEDEGPLVRSYREAVADMDSFTTLL
ncbi:hypothetical protein FRC01_009988 [Tulasnella sp. 417]|nr:hypothetical protein FRC01_009988 [Tulasnella sp. 417]